MAEPLTLYELWEDATTPRPPRSRLYHLPPVGVGTAYVESLTGYVARLAEAHSVPTRALVVREILPRLGRPHLLKPADNSLSAFWWKGTRSLNGLRGLVRDWVQAVETLTARTDVRWLTCLPWAEVLTPLGLLRPTRAWCPACYDAWQTAGQPIYEPLLWTLQGVAMCLHHRRRLQTVCPQPDCRQALPLLAPRARPGYCSQCGCWLGSTTRGGEIEDDALGGEELTWQTWVVEAVGELVAAGPHLPGFVAKEHWVMALRTCVEQGAGGNMSALARQLGVSVCTVSEWQQGRQVPHLALLLRVCDRLSLSPLRLLTGGVAKAGSLWVSQSDGDEAPPRPTRSRTPFDTESVRGRLEEALASEETPPPAMREIARRLGYAHSDLHTRFPDLCRAISARYLAYRRAGSVQRRAQLLTEVRDAVRQVDAQGLYPSANRVALLLSKPGFIRHPEAMATWHEALRDLGWQP